MLQAYPLNATGHKISDVSEKSGGAATSEDTISANGGNRSPAKIPNKNQPNPLKASFSLATCKSNNESEQKVLDLLEGL